MPDPSWPSCPPEANYLRLAGPGATGTATTLASAAVWEALMAGHEVAFAVSTLNTAATALNFEGLGGAGSATAATGLNTSLQLLAGWVQERPPILASAVSAYETAVSAMIPAEASLANRTAQASDVAMNPLVLGALTPAIVALDVEYFGEHWPHNAGAGATYGAALAALLPALAVPPPIAPPGASPGAPASAAAVAVAEAAGQTVTEQAMAESGQVASLAGEGVAGQDVVGQAGQAASALLQPLQSAMQPLTGMFQAPMQALQSLSGGPQALMGALSQVARPAESEVPAALLGASPSAAGLAGPGVSAVGLAGSPAGVPGVGGPPGAALTSYTRPTSSFAPEGGGRPVGLNSGLLSGAEPRGPTTTGGGPVPVSSARAGMLGSSKDEDTRRGVPVARVVVPSGHGAQHEPS